MFKKILLSHIQNTSKNLSTKPKSLISQNLRNVRVISVRWKHKAEGFSDDDKINVPRNILRHYEVFSEETAPVILDIEEERRKIEGPIEEGERSDPFQGISLQRGKSGVFEIEELVELLRREKAKDLFVVKLPPELCYADYMVIVTAKSNRHLSALAELTRKVYKKKMNHNDHVPIAEGKTSTTWKAVDLNNIILHIFDEKTRQHYDLETLWSIGKEYDSLSNQKENSFHYRPNNYLTMLADLEPLKPKEES